MIQGLDVLEVCRIVGLGRKLPAPLAVRQRITAEEAVDLFHKSRTTRQQAAKALTNVAAAATKGSSISMYPSALTRLDSSSGKSFGSVSRPAKNACPRISQIRSFQ